MTATSDYLNQPIRSEAEARAAAKPKVRCPQGEVYGDDPFERRMFKRTLDLQWEPAKSELIRVIEDLQLANPPKAIQALKDYLSDFESDFINVDPRKGE